MGLLTSSSLVKMSLLSIFSMFLIKTVEEYEGGLSGTVEKEILASYLASN